MIYDLSLRVHTAHWPCGMWARVCVCCCFMLSMAWGHSPGLALVLPAPAGENVDWIFDGAGIVDERNFKPNRQQIPEDIWAVLESGSAHTELASRPCSWESELHPGSDQSPTRAILSVEPVSISNHQICKGYNFQATPLVGGGGGVVEQGTHPIGGESMWDGSWQIEGAMFSLLAWLLHGALFLLPVSPGPNGVLLGEVVCFVSIIRISNDVLNM